MPSRASSIFKRLALALAAVALTLVAVEGSLSWGLLAFKLYTRGQSPLAERSHTRYDEEIGWVSRANASVPDLYGPALDLNTNERGFRGTAATPERVPAGKLRVIASGDSMTLGFGVGDVDTWVARLARLDPRVDGVNLGQGGYGIDQAYLWYARSAADIEHDVHLFTFIMPDVSRMAGSSFLGYGKPLLRLANDGSVEVTHVPVPVRGFLVPWITQNYELLRGLRIFALATRLGGSRTSSDPPIDDRELAELAVGVFEAVARLSLERHSIPVFVLLAEHAGERIDGYDHWREFFREALESRKRNFVDLVPRFRRLPRVKREVLFISSSAAFHPHAVDHYTVAGHDFVARAILEELERIPAVADRLAGVRR